MARVELPSENWVEYRTDLKAADRFAVQEAITFDTDGTNRQKIKAMAIANDLRNALLARIITAWSFEVPIPAQNSFQAADVIIGDLMDLDDYQALEDAIEPLMKKISGTRDDSSDPKAK